MEQRKSEGNSATDTARDNYYRINNYPLDSTDSESAGIEKISASLENYGLSIPRNYNLLDTNVSENNRLLDDETIDSMKNKAVEIIPRQEQSSNVSNSVQSDAEQRAEAPQSISAGDVHWYTIDTTGLIKLTGRITFSTNLNMTTGVFKLDGTTLIPVTSTPNNFMIGFDQFAFFPEGGLYYIGVGCNSGSGDYYIDLRHSTLRYNQTEVNDNMYQIHQEYAGNIVKHIDTFDNDYDHDWFKWENTESGTYQIDFYSKTPFMEKASFEALLINATTWEGYKITRGLTTASLTPGPYYIFLKAEDMHANQEYIFTIINDKNIATRVAFDLIYANDYNTRLDYKIDYNHGLKWRVRYGLTAIGTAYNKYGQPVPYGELIFGIKTYTMGWEYSDLHKTDLNGRFNIYFDFKGRAAGLYSYRGPTSVSMHTFDIADISLQTDNGNSISSGSDVNVYHFAIEI